MNTKIERLGIFLGGMRCGSTAFRDYLQQHPQVCMHQSKDPHYFSSDKVWNQGLDDYLAGWSDYDKSKHSIALESSTHYTKRPVYPKSAERMATMGMDVRLVYSVRDPIDRVESHMIHNAGKGYFDPDNKQQREETLLQAINVSNYEYQISPYERYFPPERIKVITTESLLSDPERILAQLSDYFSIDSSFSFEKFARRPRKFKNKIDIVLSRKEIKLIRKSLLADVEKFAKRYEIDTNLWRVFK